VGKKRPTSGEEKSEDVSVSEATRKLLHLSSDAADAKLENSHYDEATAGPGNSGRRRSSRLYNSNVNKRINRRRSKDRIPKLKSDAEYAAMLKQPNVNVMKKFLMTEGGDLGDNRPYVARMRDGIEHPMKLSVDNVAGLREGIKKTSKQSDFDTPMVRSQHGDFSSGVAEDLEAKERQRREAVEAGAKKTIMQGGGSQSPVRVKMPTATNESVLSPLHKASVPRKPLVPPRAPAAAAPRDIAFRRPQAPIVQSELLLFNSGGVGSAQDGGTTTNGCTRTVLDTGLLRKAQEPRRPRTEANNRHRGAGNTPGSPRTPRGLASNSGNTGAVVTQSKGKSGLGGASVFHPSMGAGGSEVASILDSLYEQRVAVSLKKQARSHLS
jgi:hypothetical protein